MLGPYSIREREKRVIFKSNKSPGKYYITTGEKMIGANQESYTKEKRAR